MNQASQWRYSFAKEIAPVYAGNPNVAAVMLGGSTARGHADRYSDIEIGVFWNQPPTDADRRVAVEATGGELLRLYPYDPVEEVWSDDLMLDRASPDQPRSGVLVEVAHYTVDFVHSTFQAVLQNYDPDLLKQNLMAGILDGVSLLNPELLHEWKTQASSYPDGLATAVVGRYAMIDHFWRWEMYLARGENLTMLYDAFSQTQQQILHVLLGFNRVYYFGFKWLELVVERLSLKPEDLLRRLRLIYQVHPALGARELAVLVEETYDLVENQMPEIDIPWLRTVFRYHRPVWDQAPPG